MSSGQGRLKRGSEQKNFGKNHTFLSENILKFSESNESRRMLTARRANIREI